MSGAGTPAISAPIGLGELADEGFARIGTEVVDPGTPLGRGPDAEAAAADSASRPARRWPQG